MRRAVRQWFTDGTGREPTYKDVVEHTSARHIQGMDEAYCNEHHPALFDQEIERVDAGEDWDVWRVVTHEYDECGVVLCVNSPATTEVQVYSGDYDGVRNDQIRIRDWVNKVYGDDYFPEVHFFGAERPGELREIISDLILTKVVDGYQEMRTLCDEDSTEVVLFHSPTWDCPWIVWTHSDDVADVNVFEDDEEFANWCEQHAPARFLTACDCENVKLLERLHQDVSRALRRR